MVSDVTVTGTVSARLASRPPPTASATGRPRAALNLNWPTLIRQRVMMISMPVMMALRTVTARVTVTLHSDLKVRVPSPPGTELEVA